MVVRGSSEGSCPSRASRLLCAAAMPPSCEHQQCAPPPSARCRMVKGSHFPAEQTLDFVGLQALPGLLGYQQLTGLPELLKAGCKLISVELEPLWSGSIRRYTQPSKAPVPDVISVMRHQPAPNASIGSIYIMLDSVAVPVLPGLVQRATQRTTRVCSGQIAVELMQQGQGCTVCWQPCHRPGRHLPGRCKGQGVCTDAGT